MPGSTRCLYFGSLLLGGCSLYTQPWAYEETSAPRADDIDLAAPLDALSAGCAACIEASCPAAYRACSESDDCVEFAACVAEEPSLAGLRSCGQGQPEYDAALACETCKETCTIGGNFRCTGRYSWPRSESTVRLQQRFVTETLGGPGKPLENTTVRVCAGTSIDCGVDTSLAPSPDESGLITSRELERGADGKLDLELDADPREGGFVGYFVLSGSDIPVYRVHATSPFASGSYLTRVLPSDTLEWLKDNAVACGATGGTSVNLEATASILFSATDCLGFEASGLTARAVGEPDSLVLYMEDAGPSCPSATATTLAGGGVGAIINLSATKPQITVEISSGDRLVSRANVTVVKGQITVLRAQPLSSAEIEAWRE